jgi:hypothetical protein
MSAVEEYTKHPDHYLSCHICGAKPGTRHAALCSAGGWQPRVEFRSYIERIAELEAENERLRGRLAVLDDLGYDPELDSITIHRDAEDDKP